MIYENNFFYFRKYMKVNLLLCLTGYCFGVIISSINFFSQKEIITYYAGMICYFLAGVLIGIIQKEKAGIELPNCIISYLLLCAIMWIIDKALYYLLSPLMFNISEYYIIFSISNIMKYITALIIGYYLCMFIKCKFDDKGKL